MFTHQRPAMPSRYSRPSASTTVESFPDTMTSCCSSSCLCGTMGWMTLARSCLTTAGRSALFGMSISSFSGLARDPLVLAWRAPQAERLQRGRRGRGGAGRRVERRLLDPAQALPGELDQMMAHHRGLGQLLELTAPERGPGQAPERLPVVAADSDLPDDARDQGQAGDHVGA